MSIRTGDSATSPLTMELDLACPAEHAFTVWTTRISTWWPPDHTVSGDPEQIVLQGHLGGRIFERTREGVEHDWGRVTAWEPPTRLAYTWHLGSDAAAATQVEIRFLPRDDATSRVEIAHSGWQRLGAAAAAGRDRNRHGWAGLLPHFLTATRRRTSPMTAGTKSNPWALTTAPGTSSYTMYRDEQADPPALVCQVGSTTLKYHLSAVEDLHTWLKTQPDWVPLGAADEKKPAAPGTVEAWGRSPDNPVRGWYGLRTGYRGRFGMYLPPLLEALGLAELTHDARNNRIRAL